MRLIAAVLGFVLKKLGLLGAMVLSLFLAYLLVHVLVPSVRETVAERNRLQEVAEERAALLEQLELLRSTATEDRASAVTLLTSKVDAEIQAERRSVIRHMAEVQRLRDHEQEVCSFVRKFLDLVTPGSACKTAQQAFDVANEAFVTAQANLSQAEEDAAVLRDPDLTNEQKLDRLSAEGAQSPVERQIDNTESEIAQKEAEEASLEESQASGVGWVVNRWVESWKWLFLIALSTLALSVLVPTLSYFVLMPMVRRSHKPMRLSADAEEAGADVRTTVAQRTLTIQLGPGEVLTARSEHVRPVQGKVTSQLLFDWTSPFTSYAAGLHGLSRITGGDGGSAATLATPDDPDAYLMRIDFRDHPGLVMYPSHVVGIMGTPHLKARWQWGIQSFATGQVRYIMFAGTGGLIVQGSGDVVATADPQGGSTRMEQNLVMGFDSRLSVRVNRTEVFWPYLRRKTPLVDYEFTGPHPLFWQKSTAAGPSNPLAKTFDAFFSALGKVLGF